MKRVQLVSLTRIRFLPTFEHLFLDAHVDMDTVRVHCFL